MGNFYPPPLKESIWDPTTKLCGLAWSRWFKRVQDALSAGYSLTPGQLPGTSTNDNASVGNVGEYIHSTIAVGSAVSLTAGSPKTVTSISLTGGDWDVSGQIDFNPAGSTVISYVQGGNSTVTNSLISQDAYLTVPLGSITPGINFGYPIPVCRISIASTTTVYLVAAANFTTSTLNAYGTIQARRVR